MDNGNSLLIQKVTIYTYKQKQRKFILKKFI